jgi:hypothetical protein
MNYAISRHAKDRTKANKPAPLSQWVSALGQSISSPRKRFNVPFRYDGGSITCILDYVSLWFVLQRGELRVAIRSCFDAQGIDSARLVSSGKNECRFVVEGRTGQFAVYLQVLNEDCEILHFETKLTPHRPVQTTVSPRDLFLGGTGKKQDVEGKVHFTQKGPASGIAYASFRDPKGGTLLYFQNLTSLNEYCALTHAEPVGIVAGEWPEIGMALPAGTGPLPAKKEVTVSDAFLCFSGNALNSDTDVAEHCLKCLASIYRLLPLPKTEYFDWPRAATRTLKSLDKSQSCTRRMGGRRYLNAYVGVEENQKPPESMVQCSVLVPMRAYEKWLGSEVTLTKQLARNLSSFYDKKAKSVVRWLPGCAFQKADNSEEEDAGRLDSWYIHHTLLNLGRLAEMGDTTARRLFFASLASATKAARHFNYQWPVFYQIKTFKVLKAESAPGKGGEHDVPGLYAHVMLQAYTLSQQKRYLTEAEKAASRLQGSGLDLLYQTNNTLLSGVVLARLWRMTGKKKYRDLSVVCVANMIARVWMWDCHYGFAKHYTNFMGASPLHECEYVAAYEEAEAVGIAVEYLRTIGDAAPQGARMLLAEYVKFLLHRGKNYFPEYLPVKVIAASPKEGKINRRLAIPLEDLSTGWKQAGQVGQEVYGSSVSFVACATAYLNYPNAPIMVFCEYPILDHKGLFLPDGSGTIELRLGGSPDLSCKVRVLAKGSMQSLQRVSVHRETNGGFLENTTTRSLRPTEHQVPGGSKVRIVVASSKALTSRARARAKSAPTKTTTSSQIRRHAV